MAEPLTRPLPERERACPGLDRRSARKSAPAKGSCCESGPVGFDELHDGDSRDRRGNGKLVKTAFTLGKSSRQAGPTGDGDGHQETV